MTRDELLKRLNSAQAELKAHGGNASDAELSRIVTGRENFVRDLRRHQRSKPPAVKLIGLAEALGKPRYYFMDEFPPEDIPLPDDRQKIQLAFRVADAHVRDYTGADKDVLRADLAAAIYEVLQESAAAGNEIGEEAAFRLIDGLVRRLLAMRLRE